MKTLGLLFKKKKDKEKDGKRDDSRDSKESSQKLRSKESMQRRKKNSVNHEHEKDNQRSTMAGPDVEEESSSQHGGSRRGKSAKSKDKELKRQLVHGFVENTIKKGVNGLRSEFLSHKRVNDLTKMTIFSRNAPKNRYKDVGCIDTSRVQLKDSEGDGYIHANYVSTPSSEKRFICCQAPLDSTIADHWKMIMQERVEVILMLCNLTEKGAKKCAEYFPSPEPGKETKTFDKFTVKCNGRKKFPFPFHTNAVINVTAIQVECEGKTHTLEHYHWVDWPDRGVPPADQAPIFLLQKIMNTAQPVVVHCSAGIGRTGSVVLIQYVLEQLAAGETCTHVDQLMIKLRDQRANSVQTDQQYLYVHQVLLNHFQKLGYLDKSVLPFLDNFRQEYKKVVITGQ